MENIGFIQSLIRNKYEDISKHACEYISGELNVMSNNLPLAKIDISS